MRLSSGVPEAEIRDALHEDALRTWGPSRIEDLRSTLDSFAHSIWVVFQEPIDVADAPPDWPLSAKP